MGRHRFYQHRERRRFSSKALRPYAEGVYFIQQLTLERGIVFVGVWLIDRAQQRMLCKAGCLIKAAADADAENDPHNAPLAHEVGVLPRRKEA